jgi:cytochrome c554/c'-like protein
MEPTASPGSPGPGNKYIRYFALIAFFVMLYPMSYLGYDLKAQPQQPARRWHPTRVPSGSSFIGDQICLECHKERVIAQRKSSMGMAMVAESLIFSAHPLMTFKNGNYKYEIARRNKESFYSVTDGKETITLPILFAFGQGKAGQTYVLRYESEFYESLVSYYNQIKGLDFTIGAPRNVPASLKEALGRRLSKNDTLNCFNCHATGAVSGGQLQLEKMTPGIRCEACHGPGGAHVAAGKAGEPNAGLIFNPARLSGDELTQDFCAACHRGNEEFSLLRSLEINNVRFQPYRIFKSKCYSDDRRISCTACHNPHEQLNEAAAYYDAKCLSCHQSKGARGGGGDAPRCRVGAKDCSSCHMPKIEPPGAHFKFTDHYIRIVKSNEAYPN